MARSLSLLTKSLSTKTTPFMPSHQLFPRSQSTLSTPNPNSEDENPTTDPHLRRLEDAIHRIIVRRSAPDWLPFIPGSSYWVPPSRSGSGGIAQLVERLANPLTDEESLATTTVRGWPSSDYFIKGAPSLPTEVKVTLVNIEEVSPSSNPSDLEDEEG